MGPLKLTCVVENTASFSSEFWAEHGLSILVEHEDKNILFDTGRSPEVLEKNMNLLDGFNDLETVVLSHGHSDHTGGLSTILKNSSADIYMHEKGLEAKYSSINGEMRFIGTVKEQEAGVNRMGFQDDLRSRLKLIKKPLKISSDIYIFTDIPMINDFEKEDPNLLIRKNGKFMTDTFQDEIIMAVNSDEGVVVISGCAHRGIINSVTAVSEYFNEDVSAVVGGTHMVKADENRKKKTVKEFKKIQPNKLVFGHCNGFDAQCMFKNEFKEIFHQLESGTEYLF